MELQENYEIVLSGLVKNPDLLAESISKIEPEYFLGEFRDTFNFIVGSYKEYGELSPYVLIPKAKEKGINLRSVVKRTPNEKDFSYALNFIKEESIRRISSDKLQRLVDELQHPVSDVSDVIARVGTIVSEAQGVLTPVTERSLKDMYSDCTADWDNAKKCDGITGVSTHLPSLDKETKGFQAGGFFIVAGRPAMGKTTVGLELAKNSSLNGHKTLFITLEMMDKDVLKKALSSTSEVKFDTMTSGRSSIEDYKRNSEAFERLERSGLQILNLPSMNELELSTIARRSKREDDIKMIVIDYIGLMSCSDKSISDKNGQVTVISRVIKQLAMELQIPIMALAQLNRGVDARPDKTPQLSDLRDSGSLEQDADFVSFCYRPEYYKISEYDDGASTHNVLELIVSKNRFGNTKRYRFQCDLSRSMVIEPTSYVAPDEDTTFNYQNDNPF